MFCIKKYYLLTSAQFIHFALNEIPTVVHITNYEKILNQCNDNEMISRHLMNGNTTFKKVHECIKEVHGINIYSECTQSIGNNKAKFSVQSLS